jgi:hypothetical protein
MSQPIRELVLVICLVNKARKSIGDVFADGEIGSVSKKPYRQIYGDHYDKTHPK